VNVFVQDGFVANVALLLSIPISRIKIVSVKPGSTIVDFQVSPAVTTATNPVDTVTQVNHKGDGNKIRFTYCSSCVLTIELMLTALLHRSS